MSGDVLQQMLGESTYLLANPQIRPTSALEKRAQGHVSKRYSAGAPSDREEENTIPWPVVVVVPEAGGSTLHKLLLLLLGVVGVAVEAALVKLGGLDLHLGHALEVGLVVDAVAQHVAEVAQGALQRVGGALLLGLLEGGGLALGVLDVP